MSNIAEIGDSNKVRINSTEVADFLKTLANSNRLVILSRLLGKEMCVGDLEKNLNISQSALSQHLGRMRAVGIVTTRRKSQQIFYRIKDARVARMLRLTLDLFYPESQPENQLENKPENKSKNKNAAANAGLSSSVIVFPEACVGCAELA